MTLGIVVYIEFPAAVARQDAQGRAQAIVSNLRAIAGPDDRFDVQPVIGRTLPGDRTTMQGLRRSHLDGLVRDMQAAPPKPGPARLPVSSLTITRIDAMPRAYNISGKRCRFSPMEWKLFHTFTAQPGEWMRAVDVVKVVWPGKEALRPEQYGSEYLSLYKRMIAKMHPHGEVLFEEVRGARRWVGPHLLVETP